MDCEHYQRLLIDVACGELALADAEQVRVHAVTCPQCGPLLRKLERGAQFAASLPTLEPSAQVSDRIMQRARAHALAARTLNQAPSRSEIPAQSLADRVREFLSQFAMGRQVAMATVMVLVTAVGLWFVPRAHQHELASGNVVNPDPDGEAGPSNGIVPAAPLDLDLRQGRIRAREDEPTPRRARELNAPAEATLNDPAAKRVGTEGTATPGAEELAVAEVADMAPAEAPAPSPESQAGTVTNDEGFARKERARVASSAEISEALSGELAAAPNAVAAAHDDEQDSYAAAPSAPPASTRAARAQESVSGFAPAPELAPRAMAPSAGVGSGNASSEMEMSAPVTAESRKGSASADALTRGMNSFRAGDHRAAIDALEVANRENNGQLPATARLSLARSYQRTGRCEAAVTHYETYLRNASTNRDVMLEAASCYRQLGRNADANRWVARANTLSPASGTPKSDLRKTEPAAPAQAQ